MATYTFYFPRTKSHLVFGSAISTPCCTPQHHYCNPRHRIPTVRFIGVVLRQCLLNASNHILSKTPIPFFLSYSGTRGSSSSRASRVTVIIGSAMYSPVLTLAQIKVSTAALTGLRQTGSLSLPGPRSGDWDAETQILHRPHT